MRQQHRPLRIVQPGVERLGHELGATLQNANEREAAMAEGGAHDVVEDFGNPVDGLGDERRALHAERHRQRVHRLEQRAVRRRVALQAARRRRRGLLLGQAVDVVVVQDDREVDVVAKRMDPVRPRRCCSSRRRRC
jgi:hypothetical protein